MAIDLGDNPIGTRPTYDQSQQIKSVLGLGNVEDVSLSTWTGSDNLQLSASQIIGLSSYDSVQSVSGRTGNVLLSSSDVGLGNVENIAISTWTGSSNLILSSSQVVDFDSAVSAISPVQSVSGKTGNVSLSSSDISGLSDAVTAASVAAAIAENPAAVRAAAKISESASKLGTFSSNLRPILAGIDAPLSMRRSVELAVIGDSTANATDEWFERFCDVVRAKYSGYRHVQKIINTTSHQWDEVILSEGDYGERYLNFDANADGLAYANFGRYDVPNNTADQFTITTKMRTASWDALNGKQIIKRYTASDSRQWYLMWISSGKLSFRWYDSGLTLRQLNTTVDAGIVDGTDFWLQIVWTPDNGAGQAQITVRKRSGDSGSFTDIQTVVGSFGTSDMRSPADPTYPDVVSFSSAINTRIYKCWIQEGDNGKIISPYFIDSAISKGQYGPTIEGSPTILTSNYSHPGNGTQQLILRMTTDTPVETLFNNTQNCVVFLNLSLNDSNSGQEASPLKFIDGLETIIGLHKDRCPLASYVFIGQNPYNALLTFEEPNAFDGEHAARVGAGLRWAVKNGYGSVDFHGAMVADGRPLADLLDSGTVHPNSTAVEEILVPILSANYPK